MVALLLALAEVKELVLPAIETLTVESLRQRQWQAVRSHRQSVSRCRR
jgi:hypothetical protein